MVIQNQAGEVGNENANANVATLNWKANVMYFKCEHKRYLARECPHAGNIHVPKPKLAQPPVNLQ